jgi:hypothetical protein
VLLLARVATAQPDPADHAAKLFEEGRDLAQAGKYDEACARFQASLELVPAVGTQLNLADCLEHRGQLASAWQLFDAAARADAAGFPARSKMARGRADTIAPHLVTLVIRVAEPAGTTLTIAGQSVPSAAEVTRLVGAGPIEVVAVAAGRPRFAQTVHGAEGQRIVVDVPATSVTTTTATTTTGAPGAPAGATFHGRRVRVYLAAGLAGTGVVGLVVGEVLALSARSAYHDELDSGACREAMGMLTCTPEGARRVDDANHRANIATGVIIAGAALAAGGVIVYLTAPRERATMVVPTASSTGVGLVVSGRF